jgi:glycolate oxidase FAD binding subunit
MARHPGGAPVIWSPADLVAAVRAAGEAGTPLRIQGRGHWLHGGVPRAPATALSVAALDGVVEYVPGDLVATVQAGTTLATLDAATREAGQQLALAPYGTDDGSIGASVATASAAPLSLDGVAMRDLVLGLTLVTGTGDVVRVGGKVVKNVAGFDLVRLATGSWGTLGVITAVSLRLHARPAVDDLVEYLLEGPAGRWLPPLVALPVPVPLLVRQPPGEAPRLVARLAGSASRAAAVRALLEGALRAGGGAVPPALPLDPATWWPRLRTVPETACALRWRTAPSHAAGLFEQAAAAFPDAVLLLDPARGSVRVTGPAGSVGAMPRAPWGGTTLAQQVAAFRAGLGEALGPHALAMAVDQGALPPRAPTPLELGVRRALDPLGLLNPPALQP